MLQVKTVWARGPPSSRRRDAEALGPRKPIYPKHWTTRPLRTLCRRENNNFRRNLRTPKSASAIPTSRHLKLQILIRPPDAQKKKRTIKASNSRIRNSRRHHPHDHKKANSNPTSGHIKQKRTIKAYRGRFKNSRFLHARKTSSTRKACKIRWFSLGFQQVENFDAISKHRPLTAPQPQALYENSPKKFDVFLAEFY